MIVDADKVKEKLAKMVEGHWNDSNWMTNQKDQAFRSAEAIRQADLSDCVVDDAAMTAMCDAYALENQQFSDKIESQAAEIERLKEDAERYRWLREVDCTFEYCKYISDRFNKGVALGRLDAAIDSAKGKS